MKNFLFGSVLVAGLAFAATSATAAPFSNGDMELQGGASGVIAGNLGVAGTVEVLDGGTASVLDDWSFSGRVLRWAEGSHFGVVNVPDSGDAGTVVANLPDVDSAISQDFDTVNGTPYEVSYQFSVLTITSNGTGVDVDFDVNIDGNTEDSVTTSGIPNDTGVAGFGAGWVTRTFQFTATGSSTNIEFISLIDSAGDDQGLFLDNVSIRVIPEPASLALLGLGGLMMLRRRR